MDIERDAEPYFEISDTLYDQEFGYDLPATQWRSFLVTNERGVGVGVISAWYNRNFRGLDYGQVHWVAIRPSYQGKGLGKAALSYTLNQLAQWHERAYLGTQSKRIPAIKLYLDFGFLPDLVEPGALEGWREVKRALKHPILEAMEEL
jgi:GNAT superfamily N-acetyltransferase